MALSPFLPAVSGITFSYTSPNLTVSWLGEATNFSVSYRIGQGAWSSPSVTASNNLVIGSLTSSTLYQFRIVANYPSGASLPSYSSFIIPSGATGPSNLRVTGKSTTQLGIEWDGPNGTYIVVWVDAQLNEFNSGEITDKSYTIKNLQADENYKIFVYRLVGSEQIGIDGGVYIDKENGCCFPFENEAAATTTAPPLQ